MKKILSIILTVTMVFSLVAAFRTPTASAFPTGTTGVVLTTSNFSTTYVTSKLSGATGNPATDPYWILNNFSHFNPVPTFITSQNPVQDNDPVTPVMTYEVYKMGDLIYGKAVKTDGTAWSPVATTWQAALVKYYAVDPDGAGPLLAGYYIVDVQTQWSGTNRFSLGTGNVDADGEYYVFIYDGTAYPTGQYLGVAPVPAFRETVYITYNITLATNTIPPCPGTATINGWITRGNGQTVLTPVDVYITSPWISGISNFVQAIYTVTPSSSGQFTLTFPTFGHTGKWRIFVRDGYNGYDGYDYDPTAGTLYSVDTNDAIIYYYLSNIPTKTLTLSTYITMKDCDGKSTNPPPIYRDQAGQPLLLHLVDQDGNPVTSGVTWTVVGPTAAAVTQISAGFYRFVITVTDSVDVKFKAAYTYYGDTLYSNQVIINTIVKDVFNPYVDVTAPNAIAPYGDGNGIPWILDKVESVYDKIPCTIGNSFNIMVNSWDMPTVMLDDWYVYNNAAYGLTSWTITGVKVVTGSDPAKIANPGSYALSNTSIKVLVTQKTKISVTINMTAWERVNKTKCPDWNPRLSETEMSQNACCHTYCKVFDICEVNSCTYGGVTLTGANITNSTTVEVGKKVDKLAVSIDNTGAPTDLACSCPYDAVLIYMTDASGKLLKNAFTVDTWGGSQVKGSMIWYNPQYYVDPIDPLKNMFDGPHINDQPIQTYRPTGIYNESQVLLDNGLKFEGGCPVILDGITFNYPTFTYPTTECGYRLVIKVFGWVRKYDACGNPAYTFPMVAEQFNPITVTPSVTTKTATYTITEGTVDPDQMLAGVSAIFDITNPGFSVDGGDTDWNAVKWAFYWNGTSIGSSSQYLVSITYAKTDAGYRFIPSCAFSEAGTLKIVGTSYYYNCTKKEVVTIEIEVVAPEFTVKIGLKDCDHTIIDNDGILTEGFDEVVYVTAVDSRTPAIHDFSTDPNWELYVEAALTDCDLPTSAVCGVVEGPGCEYGLPIRITGYDNPNLADDPMVDLYFVTGECAYIYVDSFKLVPPTVTVDPKEVPFTIPATATHLTFTVTDAHGHGASDVSVMITGGTGMWDYTDVGFDSSASGYNWYANAGLTGCTGEVDWGFVPPYSGRYYISAYVEDSCFSYPAKPTITAIGNGSPKFPCGWTGINTSAVLEAKYKAPVVDTTKPVVEASAPATVTSPMVTVTGKVTDNVGVVSLWIGAMKVDFAPDGTFSAKVEVAEGANTIKVVAFDATGLMGDKTLTVTYAVPKVTVVKIQIGSDIMTVNGKAVQIDAPAEIMNGRTFLPLRAISEALGATVDWIAETQGITVTLGKNTIGLQVGNTSAVVNGTVMTLDAAPYIKNNRTMVPFRVIAEGLGATVEWDPALRIVTVTLAQ
jgi:hypothetical protein